MLIADEEAVGDPLITYGRFSISSLVVWILVQELLPNDINWERRLARSPRLGTVAIARAWPNY